MGLPRSPARHGPAQGRGYDTRVRNGDADPSRSREPRILSFSCYIVVVLEHARYAGTLFLLGSMEAPASAAGFAQAGKNERSGVVKRIREKLIELDGGPGICEPA